MSEILKYKKALNFRANPRYLTRDFIVPLYTGTEPDIYEDKKPNMNDPGMVVDPSKILPKNFTDDMPFVTDENNPEELELAGGGSVKKKETILNTYTKLKKDLGRNPSLAEIIKKTGSTRETIYNYLGNKKLSQGRSVEAGKTGTAASVEAFKARKVDKPTPTFYEGKLGVKWPDKKTENRYIKQIKGRYQYPAQSFEFNQKVKAGELLTDSGLAKEFGINQANVERINKYIKNTEKLSYPVIGIPELEKEKRERRKSAEKKFSDPLYEQKIRGTKETQKSHMGDLYNVKVTPQTIGYAAQEINLALTGKVDPALKSIIEKQNKLYKNKPENYKQRIEDLNVKGMDYAAQTEGYKVFEALDPKTGKRFVPITTPEKTIDPLGVASETPLKNLTEEQKAQIELNRKAVMEAQAKLPAAEKRRIVQKISNIACGAKNSAMGGRITFSEGSDCFNKGLKMLEEGKLNTQQLKSIQQGVTKGDDTASVLQNLYNAGKQGVKLTGRGVTELLSIGAGPLGLVAGAAVETGFALPYLAEGDYKQALRQSIFGQVPELLGFDVGSRSEDVLKVAKEAGANPDLVKKYVELEKNMREQDEIVKKLNVLDELRPRYANNPGGAADIDLQIKRLENKLKPSEEYLTKNVYSPKEFNQITDEYLKAGKYFVNKNYEKTLPIFDKSEEAIKKSQSELFKESVTPIVGEEEGKQLLKQKGVLYEEQPIEPETIPEELPSEYTVSAAEGGYIDYIRDFNKYARGGRIHLGEGGGGPKLSRRGFLGFLAGAASLPFVGKLMKGKKGVQAAKVATKVLPKVADMPEWFNPLVTKIMNEGVDISPKAERVEDIVKVKKLEVPVPGEKKTDIITMSEYPDGRIEISADVYGGSFDSPFDLVYKPPKSDIDLATGKAINDPGEFSVIENRPRPVYSPDDADYEIDYEKMSTKDAVSDLERIEKIATGKRIPPQRVAQREKARAFVEENPYDDIVNRYGDAGDIEYDRMRDEGLLDEIE